MHFAWPWQDRKGRFSWLKGGTFALMLAPGLWLLYQVEGGHFGPIPLAGLTYWSGVWATALLLLALAVTPARTILRWTQLVTVRRMIGVTALFYTLGHIIIYFALRMWDFAFIGGEMVGRFTLIVATVATAGLIPLGVTSFDAAIRYMGIRDWNRLHNTVYVFTGLAVLHYLLSPGIYASQYLMTGMFFWLMAWRMLDRHGQGRDLRALTFLALAAFPFTALFEAAWMWAYQDFDPLWVLANNFTLTLGVSPAWQVFLLGLLIPLAGAAERILTGTPLRAGSGE